MRFQFSLLAILLATAAVGIVSWQFSPRSHHVVIEKTGRPLDLAIVGDGYFELQHPGGLVVYSRSGRFAIDSKGTVEHEPSGYIVQPGFSIPFGYRQVEVRPNGDVWGKNLRRNETMLVGRLGISRFPLPEKLLPMPHGCFQLTDASGQANSSHPGINSAGYIAQGWLERDSSDFWSHENPALIVLGVIIAAIGAQTVIFGKLIGAGKQLGSRESLECVDRPD